MSSVYDMDWVEFKGELSQKTTAELVFLNAGNIYDFLSILFGENCSDSLLREWAFQWYSEQTGQDYDVIYRRWLDS